MPNLLFIPHGFIGDRLLTTSAMAVAKRYYPELKTYFYLTPDFGYMDETILASGVVDGIVTNEKEIDGRWDSVLTMPHCRFDTNPVRVYCESFIENLPINADLTPAFIDVSKLSMSDGFQKPVGEYVTYQIDWQNRTSLDIELIINKLTETGITCIPVGSMTAQQNQHNPSSTEFIEQQNLRRYSLNETLHLIAGARLHLCMNGGTAMFAGYVKTRCAMTTDWFYIRHNDKRLDPYAYLNWIKQTPRDMSGDEVHHMFNPVITEMELVDEVIRLLEYGKTFVMPPNLVKYPRLINYFVTNNAVSFEGIQK